MIDRVRTTLAGLAMLLLLALLPLSAGAVSLGNVEVLSNLGEPIRLRVQLMQARDLDPQRLRVGLASPDQFKNFGLEYAAMLDNLEITVQDTNGTDMTILVTSSEPMNEPFMEMLLQVSWPGGSLMREYVTLFDPPGPKVPVRFVADDDAQANEEVSAPEEPVQQQAEPDSNKLAPVVVVTGNDDADTGAGPAAVVVTKAEPVSQTPPQPAPVAVRTPLPATPSGANDAVASSGEESQAPEPATLAPKAQEPMQAEPAPEQAAVEPDDRPDVRTQLAIEVGNINAANTTGNRRGNNVTHRVYTVQPGDSLWNIALKFNPPALGGNIYPMLLGIHDLNPGAFLNENISLLKVYSELLIPNSNDLARIDPRTAQAEFDSRWQAGIEQPQIAAEEAQFTPIALAGEADDEQTGAGQEPAAVDSGQTGAPEQETAAVSSNNGISPATASSPLQLPGNGEDAAPEAQQAAADNTPEESPPQPPPQLAVASPRPALPAEENEESEADVEGGSARATDTDAAEMPAAAGDTAAPETSPLADFLAEYGDPAGQADNPQLADTVATAHEVQDLLASRRARRIALQKQLEDAHKQLEAARAMAASLAAVTPAAPASTTATPALRVYVMGAVASGLSAALIFSLVMVLRISGELKTRRAGYGAGRAGYGGIAAAPSPILNAMERAGKIERELESKEKEQAPPEPGEAETAGEPVKPGTREPPVLREAVQQKTDQPADTLDPDYAELISALDLDGLDRSGDAAETSSGTGAHTTGEDEDAGKSSKR